MSSRLVRNRSLPPLLIPAVVEGFIPFLTRSWPWTVGCTEDRLILHVIVPLDRLAVEPSPYPECEYHPRGDTGEPEGLVIAGESDDVGDHTEDGILVHEEGIGFPALKSGQLFEQ